MHRHRTGQNLGGGPFGGPPGWSHGRTEPEYRALYEWLDTEFQRTAGGWEWGVWGGVTGTAFGIAGGAMGVLGGVFNLNPDIHPWVAIVPMSPAAIVSCGAAFAASRVSKRRTASQSEMRRTLNQERHFLWHLILARRRGLVKAFLGETCAQVLNEGASHVLRCHRALRSVAWGSAEEQTEYSAVRARVGNAMDLAMAKLLAHVAHGSSSDDQDIRSLLEDMKAAADEAIRTSSRLETGAGDLAASTGLRAALSEMRLLNQAQDEIEDFQQQR